MRRTSRSGWSFGVAGWISSSPKARAKAICWGAGDILVAEEDDLVLQQGGAHLFDQRITRCGQSAPISSAPMAGDSGRASNWVKSPENSEYGMAFLPFSFENSTSLPNSESTRALALAPGARYLPGMAQPPLISLSDVRLSLGAKPLFEGVTLSLSKGERAALVGRNGAGKSTLMRIISEQTEADSGQVWRQPGTTFATVVQEPRFDGFDTVLDYVSEGLEYTYMAEAELMEFGVDRRPIRKPCRAASSAAWRWAKAFAAEPDVILLDEPTNHLDVPMIEYLEGRLKAFKRRRARGQPRPSFP